MDEQNTQPSPISPPDSVSFIALGGLEDVTRNLYLYEYKDQILIVDCGIGFPDETMLGVDLFLPDITYLQELIKNKNKKIVGMLLTHGHEDHIGGVPFILPQLNQDFPIYASPFTARLTNEKLKEFHLPEIVKTVKFEDGDVRIGDFTATFIRVTHSVPDSANFFIRTPVGNFFHGSDFKFDLTPHDGKRTEFNKIMKASTEGVLCLMTDCLGTEREGHSPSEEGLEKSFEREMKDCTGKFIITTYSSNVARLNQAIEAAEKTGRKVCFVGRSVIKVAQIAEEMGYLKIKKGTEVGINDLKNYKPSQLLLFVAGSQGQDNSSMTRIANNEHKEIKLGREDLVVFSSDIIPGNELAVSALSNTISKRGTAVLGLYNRGNFHVSGHGSQGDHRLMMSLIKPKYILPISGTYKHMVFYKDLAKKMGYGNKDTILIENGQIMHFGKNGYQYGKKIETKNVFVDQVSGEEVEHYVVRDREKLAKEGVVIVMAEVRGADGQLVDRPEIIARGSSVGGLKDFSGDLMKEIVRDLSNKKEKVTNWAHIRHIIGDTAQKQIYRKFRSRPLVLPVIIEV